MKTYSVIIEFKMPENTPNSIFSGLDEAFASVIFEADGECLNVSDYIELEKDK